MFVYSEIPPAYYDAGVGRGLTSTALTRSLPIQQVYFAAEIVRILIKGIDYITADIN